MLQHIFFLGYVLYMYFNDRYFLNVMYCSPTSSTFCLYNLQNVYIQIYDIKSVESGWTGKEPFDSDVPKIIFINTILSQN
jgi:hypothetical protein